MKNLLKKKFPYNGWTCAVRADKHDDNAIGLCILKVVCIKGRKKVKGLTTCLENEVKESLKKLIKGTAN